MTAGEGYVCRVSVEWYEDLGCREEILRNLEQRKSDILEAALWFRKPRRSGHMITLFFEVYEGRIPIQVQIFRQPNGKTTIMLRGDVENKELGLVHVTPLDTLSNDDLEEKIKVLLRDFGLEDESIY